MTKNLHMKSRMLSCILAWWASGAMAADVNTRVVVVGSTTMKPIVEFGAESFEKTHPGVDIVIDAGGSVQGVALTASGMANIGMVSRAMDAEERKQFPDLVSHLIGFDGIVIVVNPSNAVSNLTEEQVRDLYTGKISNWKTLGGKQELVAPVALGERHGTTEVFLNRFDLRMREGAKDGKVAATFYHKGKEDYSAVTAKIVDDHRRAIAEVIANPQALSYVSFGQAMQIVSAGQRVRFVYLNGIAPTVPNLQSGAYSFRRPLFLVTRGKADGIVREFIDFLSGPQGRAIIAGKGYIPAGSKQSAGADR